METGQVLTLLSFRGGLRCSGDVSRGLRGSHGPDSVKAEQSPGGNQGPLTGEPCKGGVEPTCKFCVLLNIFNHPLEHRIIYVLMLNRRVELA